MIGIYTVYANGSIENTKESKETTPYTERVFGVPKARVSCQEEKSLIRMENRRYDFQIIIFRDLKHASSYQTPPKGSSGTSPA